VTTFTRWLVVVSWMSVIFALSSISSLQVPYAHAYDFLLRKLAHLGEYAVLTTLFCWAFQLHVGSRMRAWLLAVLAAVLYGVSDEWHQHFVAGRYGSFRDVGIDVLGIAASYALAHRQPFLGMTPMWQCQQCQGTRVHRSRRRGLLEWFARFIRLAPFRCDICGHRFWRFTRRGR
jgi:VanZ like family